MISVFFIVVSIVSFCLKTHPDMRVPLIRNVTVQGRKKKKKAEFDKLDIYLIYRESTLSLYLETIATFFVN